MGCTQEKYAPKNIRDIRTLRAAQEKKALTEDRCPKVAGTGVNGSASGSKDVNSDSPIHIIDQQILEIDGEYVKITMLGRF